MIHYPEDTIPLFVGACNSVGDPTHRFRRLIAFPRVQL